MAIVGFVKVKDIGELEDTLMELHCDCPPELLRTGDQGYTFFNGEIPVTLVVGGFEHKLSGIQLETGDDGNCRIQLWAEDTK